MHKNILLIDPPSDGHHTTYMSHVAGALLRDNYAVYSFHSNNAAVRGWLQNNNIDTTQFIDCYTECGDLFDDVKHSRFKLITLQLKKWRLVKRCITALKKKGTYIDSVFFLYVDLFYIPGIPAWLMDLFFRHTWACLCFRPPHAQSSFLKRHFFDTYSIMRSSHCKKIGILEETLLSSSYHLLPKRKLGQFPDFCDTSTLVYNYNLIDTIRETAKGRSIIGTIGSISQRKGIIPLLQCAIKLKNEPYFFVFAGKLSEASFTNSELDFIQQQVSSNLENCFFSFGFIEDELHFNAIVNCCDILTILYEKFPYSSNIFSKAAEFKKLIIGSDYDCIGSRIKDYNFGIAVDNNDVNAITNSIRILIKQYSHFLTIAKFNEYLAIHSSSNVKSAVTAMIHKMESTL